MKKKRDFMKGMKDYVSEQIIAIYDAIQTDKDGNDLMTPLEARDVARKYGEKLAQILVADVLEAVYPSGASSVAENLTKENATKNTFAGARRINCPPKQVKQKMFSKF